jgi:hypothetical protein
MTTILVSQVLIKFLRARDGHSATGCKCIHKEPFNRPATTAFGQPTPEPLRPDMLCGPGQMEFESCQHLMLVLTENLPTDEEVFRVLKLGKIGAP